MWQCALPLLAKQLSWRSVLGGIRRQLIAPLWTLPALVVFSVRQPPVLPLIRLILAQEIDIAYPFMRQRLAKIYVAWSDEKCTNPISADEVCEAVQSAS